MTASNCQYGFKLGHHSDTPWRRTGPSESQEVLRRGASETGFRASRPEAQSGAHSKKPRVVRGSVRLQTSLSRLEGLVLAERAGFEPAVGSHLRLISSQVHSTTLPPLQNKNGSTRNVI